MTRIIFYTILFALFFQGVSAQQVIKIADLEKHTKSKNDTLYIINFWATWCKPCIQELPAFELIYQDYKSDKVKVLLVALEFKKDYPKLTKFIIDKNIKSQVVILDEPNYNSWIPKIDKDWSGSIPATLFVKGSNKMSLFKERTFEYKELKEIIETLL